DTVRSGTNEHLLRGQQPGDGLRGRGARLRTLGCQVRVRVGSDPAPDTSGRRRDSDARARDDRAGCRLRRHHVSVVPRRGTGQLDRRARVVLPALDPHLGSATRLTLSSFVAALFVLAAVSTAAAQSGRVQGTVEDIQHRPVPGVTVTVAGTAFDATTTTDGRGAFSGAVADPARCDVRAALDGFAVEEAAVTVPRGGTVEAHFPLRPRYTETVVVTASRTAQTLSSAPATVTVISSQDIEARAGDDVGDLCCGTAGLH